MRYNCLVREFDDRPRWVNHSHHQALKLPGMRSPWFVNFNHGKRAPVSCHIRKRYMAKQNYNIYALEFTLPGGAKGPQGVYLCPSHLTVLQVGVGVGGRGRRGTTGRGDWGAGRGMQPRPEGAGGFARWGCSSWALLARPGSVQFGPRACPPSSGQATGTQT